MNPAISAGHQATLDAANEVLRAGGNAFDAGIAAYLASFIAEPCMSSAGGGAFATVFRPGESPLVFDFFCQTPLNRRPVSEIDFFPIEVNFGDTSEIFQVGHGSTAVPGAIAGIFELHKHLASMPMTELVQPAIELAKHGVEVNDFQFFDFDLLKHIVNLHPRGKELFYPNGKLIGVGETMQMPGFADFLDYLASEGKSAFYQGEVAQKIVADYQENGGFLTLEDFSQYEVIIRNALHFKYKGKHVLTNPLPSTGGTLLALACGLNHSIESNGHPFEQQQLENLHKVLQEVDSIDKSLTNLALQTSKMYGNQTLGQFIPGRADRKWGSTSHFNIVDQWGNAISLSTTNGEGCGYFVEGTDIQLNNMLGEAALLPNGFHSWAPNVRLSSMMSPTIVLDEFEKLELVLGSGGASRIPSAIFQTLSYLIDYQLPLQEAINAPRVHLEHKVFNQEPGFKNRIPEDQISQKQIHFTKSSMFFGGVHTVARFGDRFMAAGDGRRDGVSWS